MLNKKSVFGFFFLFLIVISIVGAVPPVQTTIQTNDGLTIEDTQINWLKLDTYHNFRFRVYNMTNGEFLNDDDVNCSMGIINSLGEVIFQELDITSTGWVFSANVSEGNFTKLGTYHKGINCISEDGTVGGVSTRSFEINGFGEGLDTAHSIKFNSSMLFILLLFLIALIGLFMIESYIGKFALYWVVHILFVVGTFCLWQFNLGYTTSFLGLVAVWKILFYVSIIAVFPMIILSLGWIFYIHTFNEHFDKIIRNGGNSEDAFRIANRKSRSWFYGKR